jgi:hypothetical protein
MKKNEVVLNRSQLVAMQKRLEARGDSLSRRITGLFIMSVSALATFILMAVTGLGEMLPGAVQNVMIIAFAAVIVGGLFTAMAVVVVVQRSYTRAWGLDGAISRAPFSTNSDPRFTGGREGRHRAVPAALMANPSIS